MSEIINYYSKTKTILSNPHRAFNRKFFLVVSAFLQLFFALTISTGMLPQSWAWSQILIALAGCVFFDEYFGLLSLIIALPFWLALPNSKFDSLSAWRIVAAIVVLRSLASLLWKKPIFTQEFWKGLYLQLPKWDKYMLLVSMVAALSILFSKFPVEGLKKFLFFASVYSLYLVAVFLLRGKERIREATLAFFAGAATIVLIGYVQLTATFFSSTYHFWQYWATVISRAYYGSVLSNSLVYSNSWFSFAPHTAPTLRMFSMLPDSHAFAIVAMISFIPAVALLADAKSKSAKIWLWIYIALTSLAIDLSGTRGAWAGAVVPFIFAIYFFWKWVNPRIEIRRTILIFVLLAAFVVISPFAQKLIARLDHGYQSGDFLQRAESIYDLQESSNAGRLMIWKHTIVYDLHHPILGTGLGNFVVTLSPNLNDYNTIANTNQKAFNLPARYVTAHDLYLDVLTEIGLLGFILFALYFYKIVSELWKYGKHSRNQYLIAELIVLIWIIAYSVFDGTLANDRVLLFFVFSLAISGNIILLLKSEDSNV